MKVPSLLSAVFVFAAVTHAADDWPAYGGGPEGTRYSPLKQITPANVAKLQVAWTYDATDGPNPSQTQPIVVGDVLYGLTPKHKVIALNARTGAKLWEFDSGIEGRGPNRGVTYWAKGADRRILTAVGSYIYALNARTGKPVASFGTAGRIDLREGLGRDPQSLSIVLTTPGVVYKNLLIVGGRTPEALPAPPGDIRAFDIVTGLQRWAFHTIPRPGEPGHETWPPEAWRYTGSVNNWAGMVLDQKRGIVYVPTGSAASDFYGADRLGDNLYANSLLALDAATGKRLWHFQAVKHDIWDRDFPSPPNLVSVIHNGKRVDAVAQVSKQGFVYLLDRVTGQPLFPMESRPYPASTVPSESASLTQALPSKPAPFARQTLTADLLTRRSPEAARWAQDRFRAFRSEGQFVPLSVNRDTVVFPGFDGGADWGGAAVDPQTGLLYINSNDIAWTGALAEALTANNAGELYRNQCAGCHRDDLRGTPPSIPSLAELAGRRDAPAIAAIIRNGAGRMPAFPGVSAPDALSLADYLLSGISRELPNSAPAGTQQKYRFTGYKKFLDPEGYPAVAPPWGTLNAIDLNTGEFAWKIPLGEYPELASAGMKDTGTENYGGPLVTGGGLLFIAATNFDRKFRAFDKTNGKLLWETTLPSAGHSTPITYQAAGKQFVVIYATGGRGKAGEKSGGTYVAFTLP